MTAPTDRPSPLRPAAALGLALAALALWAYWPTLGDMAWRWGHDPQYSHGYLVPAFAVYLLWVRRARLATADAVAPAAWGLALIGAAAALRLAGAFYHYSYLDQISLLPCLAGLLALVGGRAALAWSWPAVAFLAFMVPLPHTVSLALSAPMQSFATMSSTFFLQVFGRPAVAEGNVILLNEIELGIVEACSGLRMLVVFFALSTAVALLIRKPLWEKFLIAFSAIPIALAANILRITVTGIVYDALGNGFGGAFFHDLAGWLMMPLGLGFLGLELLVLKRLLIEPGNQPPLTGAAARQTVEVNPVAMYSGGSAPGGGRRRARRTVTTPEPSAQPQVTPEPAPETAAQAPPAPKPESVARS
jgi:exosortase